MAIKVKANISDRDLDNDPAHRKALDAYRKEFLLDKTPPTKKPFKRHIKRQRLNVDYHDFVMVSNSEQEEQLSRLVDGHRTLRPIAVEFKQVFDRDPKGAREVLGLRPPKDAASDLMSTSELHRCFTSWKAEHPELEELPRDVAEQILDDVVKAFIKFHKGDETNPKLLSDPKRSLRFSYVRFVTRPFDGELDADIGYEPEEWEQVQVNDRALYIPRLGEVRFTGKRSLLKFQRTANLRLMSATFRLHDDGKWHIRIHFKRLAGRLVEKHRVISNMLDELTRDSRTILVGDEPEEIPDRRDLPSDDVLIQMIAKAGYEVTQGELNQYKREAPSDILESIWHLALTASKERGNFYLKSSSIMEWLQRRGHAINAKDLRAKLAGIGVERERPWLEGQPRSCYSIGAILRAYRS